MPALTGRALVAAMCLGQVGNLLPHVVVPAIMAQHLMPLWDLSAAQAGLMASAYAFGYMLAVPVLTTLTDRIDARRVLMVGSASSGIATALFGVIADGLWSATLIWGLAGIGFAGAYMPGLKALADRLPSGDSSRSITLYTGSFSIGVGLSFLVSPTRCGRRRLAGGVLCHERWSVYHGWHVPLARAMQIGTCTRTPPRFPAGSAQSRRTRLHPWLRRALLRGLRHAHLDRRLLDLCGGAKQR
jgi:MFS family permease